MAITVDVGATMSAGQWLSLRRRDESFARARWQLRSHQNVAVSCGCYEQWVRRTDDSVVARYRRLNVIMQERAVVIFVCGSLESSSLFDSGSHEAGVSVYRMDTQRCWCWHGNITFGYYQLLSVVWLLNKLWGNDAHFWFGFVFLNWDSTSKIRTS